LQRFDVQVHLCGDVGPAAPAPVLLRVCVIVVATRCSPAATATGTAASLVLSSAARVDHRLRSLRRHVEWWFLSQHHTRTPPAHAPSLQHRVHVQREVGGVQRRVVELVSVRAAVSVRIGGARRARTGTHSQIYEVR
jgi:hypothetical protein